MSILFQLNYIYKISTFKEASNYNEIESLEKYSSIILPQDFIEIIKEKTEIEVTSSPACRGGGFPSSARLVLVR